MFSASRIVGELKLREFFFRLGQVDRGAMQKIVHINIASL